MTTSNPYLVSGQVSEDHSHDCTGDKFQMQLTQLIGNL